MLEIKNLNVMLCQNDRKIIDNFSFALNKGDKAAVIGEEGNGKSTLLKLIYDEQSAVYCEHSGQIVRKGKLGYLPQYFPEDCLDITVKDYFSQVEVMLHVRLLLRLGLNVDFVMSRQRIRTLSGGEKIKIQLAKILIDQPDILLLDEPANDLDLQTLEWLEGFIKTCEQPVLYISHDETLIENTANVIIHMEQLVRKTKNKIMVTRVGYAEYVKERGLAFDKQMQVAKKQRSDHKAQMDRWQQIYSRVEHKQRAISRQDPSGGRLLKKKMKAVLSTGKRLERGEEDFVAIPQMEEAILTRFDPAVSIPQGKVVLELDIPALYAGVRQLCGAIQFKIVGPKRIGITGRNGSGKSTLLREIWGVLKNRSDVIAVYMPQDYAEMLDFNQTVIEFLAADARKETITKVRTYLGSMKFTHDEMNGAIGKLSGGQRAKVLFLDMVLKKANVLIMDEPTRNFSPLSAPEIRKTLAGFSGAIISVSHDRKYLEEVCEEIWEIEDGLQRLD